MIEALLNRSAHHMREDINQIKDKSREFFEIDDSVPIGYTYDDLKPHQSSHTGNQPDDYVANSSYMNEVDKFLQGKDNHLTHHAKYVGGADFIDKSFPTAEAVKAVMEK